MIKKKEILYLCMVVALVTFPTAGSLTYYAITKDPSMRPLGITEQSLRAYAGEAKVVSIAAIVEWDSARSGGITRRDMQELLINVFKSKGVDVQVYFTEGHNGTFVKYQVGASIIGPFPQSRAAEGITGAVAAYYMLMRGKS